MKRKLLRKYIYLYKIFDNHKLGTALHIIFDLIQYIK